MAKSKSWEYLTNKTSNSIVENMLSWPNIEHAPHAVVVLEHHLAELQSPGWVDRWTLIPNAVHPPCVSPHQKLKKPKHWTRNRILSCFCADTSTKTHIEDLKKFVAFWICLDLFWFFDRNAQNCNIFPSAHPPRVKFCSQIFRPYSWQLTKFRKGEEKSSKIYYMRRAKNIVPTQCFCTPWMYIYIL